MKKKICNYQKTTVITFVMAFVMAALPFIGASQDNLNVFVIVDYMKVKAGEDENYLDVEKDIWKPIHQERVKQGKIAGWMFYGVRYAGSDNEYNYATATFFAGRENLEKPLDGIDFEKVHPGKNMDEAMEKTLKSRKHVKSQLIRRVAFAYPENNQRPSSFKYIEVNFMKTKPGSGYLNVARTMQQPIQQQFANEGTRAGWTLYAPVYPRGFGEEFQFAAVNYYSEFSQLGQANFGEAFNKVHPGKDINEFFKTNRESRLPVRTELWEVLDMVTTEQ